MRKEPWTAWNKRSEGGVGRLAGWRIARWQAQAIDVRLPRPAALGPEEGKRRRLVRRRDLWAHVSTISLWCRYIEYTVQTE